MRCRHCGHVETSVLETRAMMAGTVVRRRRACGQCGETFSTYEIDGSIWGSVKRWVAGDRVRGLEKKHELRRRNEEIAALIKVGTPYDEISKQFGIATNSITAVARKLKLPKANGNKRRAELRNAEILLLVASGIDPQQIADKLSVTRRTVMRALCKAGLGERKSTRLPPMNPWVGL